MGKIRDIVTKVGVFPIVFEKNRQMRGNFSWHELLHRIFRKLLVLLKKFMKHKICILMKSTSYIWNSLRNFTYWLR